MTESIPEDDRGLSPFSLHKGDFKAPAWIGALEREGLDFDSLWKIDLEPIDEPNTGRGRAGWSSVSRFSLKTGEGEERPLILKRQVNHFGRTMLHPLRGVPTFEREFASILRYKRSGIPAIEPVYFGRRRNAEGVRAILVTEFLEGFTPLDEMIRTWQGQGTPGRQEKDRLLRAIAAVVRKLHDQGFQHNCLYPRHLLVGEEEGRVLVRVIDLEKSKFRPLGDRRRVRDLESLHRRTGWWTIADRLRFLKAYCGAQRLDTTAARLCQKIERRNRKKRAR
jgi:hypothetical protein